MAPLVPPRGSHTRLGTCAAGCLLVSQENRRVGSPIVTPVRRDWGRDSCPAVRHRSRSWPAAPPLRGPRGLLEGVLRREVWRVFASPLAVGFPSPGAGGRSGRGARRSGPAGWLPAGHLGAGRPVLRRRDPMPRGPCKGIHCETLARPPRSSDRSARACLGINQKTSTRDPTDPHW